MSDSHDGDKVIAANGKDAAVTGQPDAGLARLAATRRFRRPRGAPARGARGRKVILAAAAAGTLAATLLAAPPAHANSYQCNIRFYYNVDGTPYWPVTQVNDTSIPNAYAACEGAPAIARYNGGTIIAAHYQTFVGSVATYVNTDGSPNWTISDHVGDLWSAFGPPALIPYSGGTELAVAVSGILAYTWEPVGSKLQVPPDVVASSGISQNAPAIARNSAGTVIAATGTDNSLWFYWNADGSPAWGSHQVAGPGSAQGAPAIAVTGNSTEIAVIPPDGSLWLYWNADGTSTWWPEEVSGPGTVSGGVAMTHSYGGTQISAPGPGGSLMFFWNYDGTSTWHPEQVAGPGSAQGAPAMVAGNYTEAIATTAPDGSVRYYYSYDGTTTWSATLIAPPGTASTTPAITRSSTGTEIAVVGL